MDHTEELLCALDSHNALGDKKFAQVRAAAVRVLTAFALMNSLAIHESTSHEKAIVDIPEIHSRILGMVERHHGEEAAPEVNQWLQNLRRRLYSHTPLE